MQNFNISKLFLGWICIVIHVQAQAKSSLEFNYNALTGTASTGPTLSSPNHAFKFKTSIGQGWIRPDLGVSFEQAVATTGDLNLVQVFLGGVVSAKFTEIVEPFCALDTIFGYGSYSASAVNSYGFLFGGIISLGLEIALNQKSGENKTEQFSLLLNTGYRFISGSAGTLKYSQLSAIIIGAGIAWN